jgi:uncharacterized GH25 family protein
MSSTVQGYVRLANEKKVSANARVTIKHLGDAGHERASKSVQSTTTDGDGWFAFRDVDAGRYLVAAAGARAQEINLEDFTNITLELSIPSGASEPAYEPAPEPDLSPDILGAAAASIRGRVISARNGYAIEDASVMLLSGPGSAPDIAPLTNANGEFSFHGLAAGPWTLRAIAPDGASKQLRVDVRSDDTAIVTLAVDTGERDCLCAR